MEFTELDNRAWEIFKKQWKPSTMTKNKHFFVYHKDGYPFTKYYEQAKTELRNERIKRICSRLVTK
jgi:hypothetical protein